MTIIVPNSGLIDLKLFNKLLDISQIAYYSLEVTDDCIEFTFYNKNKEVINPYANTKEKASKSKSKKVKY